jgi:hypothetical protein
VKKRGRSGSRGLYTQPPPPYLFHLTAPRVSSTSFSCLLLAAATHTWSGSSVQFHTARLAHRIHHLLFGLIRRMPSPFFTAKEKRRHPWDVPQSFVLSKISRYGHTEPHMACAGVGFGTRKDLGTSDGARGIFWLRKEKDCVVERREGADSNRFYTSLSPQDRPDHVSVLVVFFCCSRR